MYGWRARLGLLVPSSNTTNEPEFHRVLPEGVSLHTGRLPLEDVTADDLAAMAETASGATDRLRHADVDVVAKARSPRRPASRPSPRRCLSSAR